MKTFKNLSFVIIEIYLVIQISLNSAKFILNNRFICLAFILFIDLLFSNSRF